MAPLSFSRPKRAYDGDDEPGSSKRQKGDGPGRNGPFITELPREMRDAVYSYLEPSYLYVHAQVHDDIVFRDSWNTTAGSSAVLRSANRQIRAEMDDNAIRRNDCVVVDTVLDHLCKWSIYESATRAPATAWRDLLEPHPILRYTTIPVPDATLQRFERLRIIFPFTFSAMAPAFASLLTVAHMDIKWRANGEWHLRYIRWHDIHGMDDFEQANDAAEETTEIARETVRETLGDDALTGHSIRELCLVIVSHHESFNLSHFVTRRTDVSVKFIDRRRCAVPPFATHWNDYAEGLAREKLLWWKLEDGEW